MMAAAKAEIDGLRRRTMRRRVVQAGAQAPAA